MENEGFVMLSLIAGFIVTLALFVYVYFRGLVLIEAYRKRDYDTKALLKWVIRDRHFEKRSTLIVLISFIGWFFMDFLIPPIAAPMFFSFVVVALAVGAFRDQKAISQFPEPAGTYSRDRKILYVYLIFTGVYFAGFFGAGEEIDIFLLTVSFLAYLQAPPIFIIVANFVIRPFLKEARKPKS